MSFMETDLHNDLQGYIVICKSDETALNCSVLSHFSLPVTGHSSKMGYLNILQGEKCQQHYNVKPIKVW